MHQVRTPRRGGIPLLLAFATLALGRPTPAAVPADAARPILQVQPRPNSQAGALNVSHPDLPGEVFDFRSCEGVLDGNRDFGLFLVRLGDRAETGRPGWTVDGTTFAYEWSYPTGLVVRFEATPGPERLDFVYTARNRATMPFERVMIHTCVPTTDAPGFFPARPGASVPADPRLPRRYAELYERLFLWANGGKFRFDGSELGARELHLAYGCAGEPLTQWGWWVNARKQFDTPFIALASRDHRSTVALAFERAAWASANVGDDRACFHLFPAFGRINPGQSSTLRGRLYLMRGTPDDAFERFHGDFTVRPR
jgi:hypothetical protein